MFETGGHAWRKCFMILTFAVW